MKDENESGISTDVDLYDQWAENKGACGLCANAGRGGCAGINLDIEALNLDFAKAQAAIRRRIEGAQHESAPRN